VKVQLNPKPQRWRGVDRDNAWHARVKMGRGPYLYLLSTPLAVDAGGRPDPWHVYVRPINGAASLRESEEHRWRFTQTMSWQIKDRKAFAEAADLLAATAAILPP
jgi:hypothetical protein